MRVSASQSFTEREVQMLHQIVTTLARGGDPRTLTRNEAFASIHRKAVGMLARINTQQEK